MSYGSDQSRTVSKYASARIDYALALISKPEWQPSALPDLHQRDLGLGKASDKKMTSHHLKAIRTAKAAAWPMANDQAFYFIYVLKGTIEFAFPEGERLALGKLDSAHGRKLARSSSVSFSEDFEALDITVPLANLQDGPAPIDRLLSGLRESLGDRLTISRHGPDSFVVGEGGPRSFFAYRDLNTIKDSDRRIHLHVIKGARQMPGGTGWHYHSMSQIFVVVSGGCQIGVEGQGEMELVTGDAMCIGAGLRHNVSAFTDDYACIELCIPADYTTIPTAPPGQ